jgi:hypothetical protein
MTPPPIGRGPAGADRRRAGRRGVDCRPARVVFAFTTDDEAITGIEMIADQERLVRMEIFPL